jgi:hypothetical protein
VSECPQTANAPASCLTDSTNCLAGSFTPTYSSFPLETYCIPNTIGQDINLGSVFDLNSFENWAYDLGQGWIVLAVSVGAAVLLSLLFFVFVRLCTGPIIWLTISLCVLGMLTVGVFFILQAKGVVVSDFITQNLSTLSYNTLIIVGSCLLGGAVLLALLVLCLRSRIAMGAKAVELGSMFLLENCLLVVLPVSQGLLIILALAGLIAGAGALYSLGDFGFPNGAALPEVYINSVELAMLIVFLVVSLWLIFFLHGCNHFMLSSAVAVWYFSHVEGSEGAPCGDSLWRMVRFHLGSVAFTSLSNGFFFIVRVLANLFSFETKDDDSALVSCCLRCLSCLFCLFRMYPFADPVSCATSTTAPTFRSQSTDRATAPAPSGPSSSSPTTPSR